MVRAKGTLGEAPAHSVTHIYDQVFDFQPSRTIPWCPPHVLDQLKKELAQLPSRLHTLPILTDTQEVEDPLLAEVLTEEFPCPNSGQRQWTLDAAQARWCLVEIRDAKNDIRAVTNPIFTGTEAGWR